MGLERKGSTDVEVGGIFQRWKEEKGESEWKLKEDGSNINIISNMLFF